MKALIAALLLALPAAAPAAVRVLSTTGELTVDGKPLKAGDALPDVEVSLASGTAVLATDGGRFQLTGPARLRQDEDSIHLYLGSLLTSIRLKAGKKFYVRTPTVVAAVRGTDFWVSTAPKRDAEICICRGALNVIAKNGPIPMESEKHLSYAFKPSEKGVTRVNSAMRGHTDAELEVLHGLLAAEKP